MLGISGEYAHSPAESSRAEFKHGLLEPLQWPDEGVTKEIAGRNSAAIRLLESLVYCLLTSR
jgi:hypothetical protein